MTAHLTERVEVLHPGSLEIGPLLDAVSSRETEFCNVCAHPVTFERAEGDLVCPRCHATPFHRSLYRYLAESILPYRRLPALYLASPSGLSPIWGRMFQGQSLTYEEAQAQLDRSTKMDLATNGRDVVVLELPDSFRVPDGRLMKEIQRILKPDGTFLYSQVYGMGSILAPAASEGFETSEEVTSHLASLGFSVRKTLSYASAVVRYLDRDLFECTRSAE